MRHSTSLLFFLFVFSTSLFAQEFPPNPKPGMCYIRCKKELVEKKMEQIIVPAYKKYTVVPAVYESVEENIIITPASKRYEYVPAVYKTVVDTFQIVDPINKITLIPVETIDTVAELEIQPAYAQFESKPGVLNCKSKNPRDCDVICYVQHEAVKKLIPIKRIVANPTFTAQSQKGEFRTLNRKEIVSPATYREIDIPAEYITITRQKLVKDETIDSTEIGALTQQEVILVQDMTDGGAVSDYVWEEIDCGLTEFNILPIYYGLNSAKLLPEAQSIIDEKLFKLLVQKPNIRIEINSHTDSRASRDFNLDLSERRARAVVNYLVSKGIKRSRLEHHGLGETQLTNKCADGVDCTEEEHAKNRRTQFRVISY